MQNIDLIYVAQPLIIMVIMFLMILYYWRKSQFTKWVVLYSALAFFLAILVKEVIQTFTSSAVKATNNLFLLGSYYGLQTVFLEVGFAYLFARYAVSKKHFEVQQASSYGTGLAFWENGILLGLLSIFNFLILFAVLGSGIPEAQTVYNILISSQPGLFYPPIQALPFILLGSLERVSSILLHFAWGYLCVIAAVTGEKKYFLVALPMGFVDFFVVFAGVLTLYGLEAIIFAWAIVSIAIAKIMTRNLKSEVHDNNISNQATSDLTAS